LSTRTNQKFTFENLQINGCDSGFLLGQYQFLNHLLQTSCFSGTIRRSALMGQAPERPARGPWLKTPISNCYKSAIFSCANTAPYALVRLSSEPLDCQLLLEDLLSLRTRSRRPEYQEFVDAPMQELVRA